MHENLIVIILAAGMGKRMKSELPKVIHKVAGFPMLWYPIEIAKNLKPHKIIVVVGHGKEKIEEWLKGEDIILVHQKEQLGTGHAVSCTKDLWSSFKGTILILCGDVPLLGIKTVEKLVSSHQNSHAALSILTATFNNPFGYGRIIRDSNEGIEQIVEEAEADDSIRSIKEINSGIYCVKAPFLSSSINSLKNQNAQEEFYLTDIVEIAKKKKEKVIGIHTPDPEEITGINNRLELSLVNKVKYKMILEELMLSGVTIIDPANTYIDQGVEIGKDSIIYPNNYIQGRTIIGKKCIIEPGCKIVDSKIGDEVTIRISSVILKSEIKNKVIIGPFAHLRPFTLLEDGVKVGNFVEIKKSHLGEKTKASHLAYIGDTTIGSDTNIGAGTITCNYDGKKKHRTNIGNRAFIGSNTSIVAPVKIGDETITGAGSTITKDVPDNNIGIGRARQKNYFRKW
jgi:bifunctional UDP-N-acetylglucosamine pyrophosphorylase/glucosamine-1-phosphate N-acetyltransferase